MISKVFSLHSYRFEDGSLRHVIFFDGSPVECCWNKDLSDVLSKLMSE